MTAHRQGAAVVALGMLLACCTSAFALNPSLDMNQYAHTAWKVRDGFFKGTIVSIAQTPDGYLWLGTEFGLLRFDGVRSVQWRPPDGQGFLSGSIRSLLVARDGRLWIGGDKGLASWKDGTLTLYAELSGQSVRTLFEDRGATVWAGVYAIPTGRLCAIQNGSAQCYGQDGSLGNIVDSIYEDSAGNLWAGAETGLWRWKPGPPALYPMPDPLPSIRALIAGEDGALLIAMRGGTRQLVHGKIEEYPLPGAGRQVKGSIPSCLLRDRNGGLWIGTTDRGLLHVHEGRTDEFAWPDGLSGDYMTSLFEDREGSVWVATLDGLDRFREFAIPTISVKQGLSNAVVGSVLAARDGSVWLGTLDGLNRWNGGHISIYRKRSRPLPGDGRRGTDEVVREITDDGLPDGVLESLFEDDRGRIWVSTPRGVAYFENDRFTPVGVVPNGYVHAIAGDSAGNLWLSDDQSLLCLFEGRLVERIPWVRLGRKDPAFALLADSSQGGLWLGFPQSGVAYFKDGEVRASFTDADGLGTGRVNGLHLDRDGSLWVATETGLSRLNDGRAETVASKNGLPCDAVDWVVEDDTRAFWLNMTCGLVRIARVELAAWVADPARPIHATVFDSSAGVRSHSRASTYSPRVAKSTDGRVWLLPYDGVSVIDPRHLPFNSLPPPVHIEHITADDNSYDASSNLRLPPLIRDLEIDYTALSFVVPEKVLFRVKLEGRDRDWRDAGNRRHAMYSDLRPGNYRFHVIACNNSGVWNGTGASMDFSIAPAYYQTTWFRASFLAAFGLFLWALYQYRLREVAREFNRGLEARVSERTRIARELHDTLLQSFHGLLVHFQAATNLLPGHPEEAKDKFESIIDRAACAIIEGRDAVQDLRSSAVVTNDLAQAISAVGDELAVGDSGLDSAIVCVNVEGTPCNLHPILRDDVYRIAVEAVRNAVRHADAHLIQVDVQYGDRQLGLRIRDDGKGIDPKVLDDRARAGHWGLPGMRERAELIGGRLEVRSRIGRGTEIDLSIPASMAYANPPGSRRRWWRGTKTGASS
jgi:signal transduction histidine kinase/ligand-binding sensor domain-containing protein